MLKDSDKLQVPGSHCFRRRLKTGGFLKDLTKNCGSDKVKANIER